MGQSTGTNFTANGAQPSSLVQITLNGPMFDGPGAKDLGNLTHPWLQLFAAGLATNTVLSATGAPLTIVCGTGQFVNAALRVSSMLTTVTGALALPVTPATDVISFSVPASAGKNKLSSLPANGTVDFKSSTGASTGSFFYLIIGTL